MQSGARSSTRRDLQLDTLSDDERGRATSCWIASPPPWVQVADAKNLRRSLPIAVELAESGIPLCWPST